MTIRTRKIRVALAVVVALAASAVGIAAFAPPGVAQTAGDACERLSGGDRYATAAEIALEAFPDGAQMVLIARGDGTPSDTRGVPVDALAGSYGAGAENAPILLTPGSGPLPAETVDAIETLGAQSAIILGQTTAVSVAVEDELEDLLGADNVDRIGGRDRFETAAFIAEVDTIFVNAAGERSVFLANGLTAVDALSAGGPAYAEHVPILLTQQESLNEFAADFIEDNDVQRVYIVGGAVAVSAATEAQVETLNGGGTEATRFQGVNRAATAVDLAIEFLLAEVGWSTEHFNLANGSSNNLVDAVAGGPLSGVEESMLLLTESSSELGAPTADFLDDLSDGELQTGETVDEPASAHILGGTSAISNALAAEACELAGIDGEPPVREATALALTPETDINPSGSNHTVTASVTDQAGDPMVGAVVKFELYRDTDSDGNFQQVDADAAESSGNNSEAGATAADLEYDTFTGGTDGTSAPRTRNPAGQATFTFTDRAGVGVYLVVACVDTDGDGACSSISNRANPGPSGPVVVDSGDPALDTARKQFVPARAASAGTFAGTVAQDCSGDPSLPNGGSVGIFTSDRQFLTFTYGTVTEGDTYKVDSATTSTEAQFETACSIGDALQVTYNPNPGTSSSFTLTNAPASA